MKKVMSGIKTDLVLSEIEAHPELWDQWTVRTEHEGSPHKGCHDIWLRFRNINDWAKMTPIEFCNSEYEPQWYDNALIMRNTKTIIEKIFTLVGGEELGACLVTKVPPGQCVDWHEDNNWNANHFLNKYLLIIQSDPLQFFETQGEKHHGKPGELYAFDNRIAHRVMNDSDTDRISLIFSVKFPDLEGS